MQFKSKFLTKATGLPQVLYHATSATNLDSIKAHGILTKYYGEIHGTTETHPPKPAIYLSREQPSNNLHTRLFERGEVVVLQIDFTRLDPNELWPDDFIYKLFEEEEILQTPGQVAKAFGVTIREGEVLLENLNNAMPDELVLLLKPLWKWYLSIRSGGEVAYTADIPSSAILSVRNYSAHTG